MQLWRRKKKKDKTSILVSASSRSYPDQRITTKFWKLIMMHATEEAIRSNFIRLALKWHPDKKRENNATSRFQDINEAYKVLSDPNKRRQYDRKGFHGIQDYNVIEFLDRYKGLILTCNGLGIGYPVSTMVKWWRSVDRGIRPLQSA
ncbi:unnamed protein product [Musa banksii]